MDSRLTLEKRRRSENEQVPWKNLVLLSSVALSRVYQCPQKFGSLCDFLSSALSFRPLFEQQRFLIYKTKTLLVARVCVCVCSHESHMHFIHFLCFTYTMFLSCSSCVSVCVCVCVCVSLSDPSATVFPPPTTHVTLPLATPTVAMATGITTEQRWLCQMYMGLPWKLIESGCHGYDTTYNV